MACPISRGLRDAGRKERERRSRAVELPRSVCLRGWSIGPAASEREREVSHEMHSTREEGRLTELQSCSRLPSVPAAAALGAGWKDSIPMAAAKALVGLSLSHVVLVVQLWQPTLHLHVCSLALAVCALAASTWYLLGAEWPHRLRVSARGRDVATQCSESDLPALQLAHPSVIALRDMLQDKGFSPPPDDELRRHLEAARATGSEESYNVAAGFRRVIETERWRVKRAAERAAAEVSDSTMAVAVSATERCRAAEPLRTEVRGRDRHGRPCLRVRVCEPLDTFPEELLATLERHFFGPTPPAHAQLCVIVDLSGMKAQRPPLAAGLDLVRQLRAHYPQRAASVHVVLLPCAWPRLQRAPRYPPHPTLPRPPTRPSPPPLPTVTSLPPHPPVPPSTPGLSGTSALPRLDSHAFRRPFARWVVTAVCSLLDSRTAKKVIVHDPPVDGVLLSLATHFSPAELPRLYGGREDAPEAESPGGGADGATPGTPTGTPNASFVTLKSSGSSESGEEAEEEEADRAGRGQRRVLSSVRLVWTLMGEEERALVEQLRAKMATDAELADLPRDLYGDDELLRYLSDVRPRFDITHTIEALRTSWRVRSTIAFPIADDHVAAWRQHVRVDGVALSGERAVILVMSRTLQEILLRDPEPFIMAVLGLMESVRRDLFHPGVVESVQTIVQVERGFRLSMQSVPIAATQRMMSLVSDLYPSYTSRILIVNLPGYLAWFVGFVKGFLCEGSANKIELVSDYSRLLDFYDEDNLPEYYRTRRGIAP